MIFQLILDFFSSLAAGIAATIPPFPPEVQNTIDAVGRGGSTVAAVVSKFNPILPFDVIAGALAAWIAWLNAWAVVTAVRVVLWVFNR